VGEENDNDATFILEDSPQKIPHLNYYEDATLDVYNDPYFIEAESKKSNQAKEKGGYWVMKNGRFAMGSSREFKEGIQKINSRGFEENLYE